jgi:diguanylate cyclase (GGDEF)-like protein
MEHGSRLLRGHALAAAGVLLLMLSTTWLLVGLGHEWAHPALGWLPVPVTVALAGFLCSRAARAGSLDDGTRRFWRHLTLALAFFTAGVVANMIDAVGGERPSQRIGPVALICYLMVLGIVLWALLRLPSWQRTRADWIRFGLDACVVLVTSGAFAWQFSLREHDVYIRQAGSAGPMLALVAVGFVSFITFAKVAFAGAGRLDRRALHLLAVGAGLSAVSGGMTPFLSAHPYLSSSLVSVPVAALGVQLAAIRQLRGDGSLPRPRALPRTSVAPYVAVAAMAGLLLSAAGGSAIVRAAAVMITLLVMARQILALRENRRLLATVDANLRQLRDYQEQLTHQATHDHLTGVANRTCYERFVADLLGGGEPFHVALLDMDDFKSVNDRLGHHAGDALLVVVSRRLEEVAGGRAMVARLGGDEFVLVLRGSDDLLPEVLRAMREPRQVHGSPVSSQVSIGVTASRPGDSPEELLRRADVAMYAAKALGGNRSQAFDPAMDDRAQDSARLGADLTHALERDEFHLLYQPIVGLPDHRPVGVEALLRWRHPTRGLVSPDVFIPLAERSGKIVEIGRWVLESACRQAAEWQARFGDAAPAKMSINVSARQLAEPDFVSTVEEILSRTGVDRTRLLLEVTETAVLGAGAPIEAVHALRANGLRVALDDFGTGQSSLSLLLNCPVDVLKVDRSFVSGSAAADAGAVIVENLIGFTDGLRLEAVAEGVETAEQARRLHEAGYRLAQGYLFGRPATAVEIEGLIEAAVAAA